MHLKLVIIIMAARIVSLVLDPLLWSFTFGNKNNFNCLNFSRPRTQNSNFSVFQKYILESITRWTYWFFKRKPNLAPLAVNIFKINDDFKYWVKVKKKDLIWIRLKFIIEFIFDVLWQKRPWIDLRELSWEKRRQKRRRGSTQVEGIHPGFDTQGIYVTRSPKQGYQWPHEKEHELILQRTELLEATKNSIFYLTITLPIIITKHC